MATIGRLVKALGSRRVRFDWDGDTDDRLAAV
jgi:hypothetical protein